MMATTTVETYEDGVLVHTEDIETPLVPAPDLTALKAKLAKANSTASLKAVLGDVLDALDAPQP